MSARICPAVRSWTAVEEGMLALAEPSVPAHRLIISFGVW